MFTLFENYSSHKNIEKLSSLILQDIAENTIKDRYWEKLDKDIKPTIKDLIYCISSINLDDINVVGKGFDKEFRQFIKEKYNYFSIHIKLKDSNYTNGKYSKYKYFNSINTKEITLYCDKYDIEKYFNSLDGKISNMNKYNLLKFLAKFKNVLIHEFQHAYDDKRSNGNYIKNIVNTDDDDSTNYIKYVNTPHEISAFFTGTASEILDYSYKPIIDNFLTDNKYDPSVWSEALGAFIQKFPVWKNIPEKTKIRLTNRLYVIWSNKYKEDNIINIDITDKLKTLCDKLKKKFNTDDIDFHYKHKYGFINCDRMKVDNIEIEKEILDSIIKLADTYRKTVGFSVYKNFTSKYVTKTSEYLKKLNFKKNFKPTRDYRFNEHWIRYTKRKKHI